MREVFPTYDISPYPVGGAAGTKEFIAGNLEMVFSSTPDLRFLYARQEWYKDVPEEALKTVHMLHLMYAHNILVTTPEVQRKYGINSWKDLHGKKVALFSVKMTPHLLFKMNLKVVGVDVTHVEMDFETMPDALKKGDIVACVAPITGGTPPPWVLSLTTKVKVVVLNPSADELKVLEKEGVDVGWFSSAKFKEYGIDVLGLDKIFGVIQVLGWHSHPKFLSEDDVYRLLKELIRRKDELVKMSKYFAEFAEDPIGMQVKAISLVPQVPVHPGLAKLLKEYGVWKESWKVAS